MPTLRAATGATTALSNTRFPANVSALLAPTPPADFAADISYRASNSLNPLGVYLCVIDCMYYFTMHGWHEELVSGIMIRAERQDVKIAVKPALAGPLPLETSHVVVGLYETILDIATHSHFCEALAWLTLHRRLIGSLTIEKAGQEMNGLNASSSTIAKIPPSSNAVTYPSGRYVDHDDQDFSVTYTFTGARIDSKSIFLIIIDALAICAEFDQGQAFVSLQATGLFGDCQISVSGVQGPYRANYSFLVKSLMILVTDIMLALRRFGEVTFQLKWQGNTMAEGSIKLVNRATLAYGEYRL